MFPREWLLLFATCLALLSGTALQAQSSEAPGPGGPAERLFTPDWDGICAVGAALGEGCDTIRAREVADAADLPWRAIGRVNFASTQVRGHCTGTLVGERVVVTAAHCLYNRLRKSWLPARSILFAAGYQRGGFVAVSRVERYVLDPGHDTGGQAFVADPPRDWALLILEEPIGRDTGFVAPRTLSPEALWRSELVFAGYPSVREHLLSVERDCGGADYVLDGRLLVQQCAVMQGDSGGPVLAVEGGALVLVGVLSGVIRDRAGLVSGSVPVAVFADALREALGPEATPDDLTSLPAAPVAGSEPPPAKPAPPIPVYPLPPPRGR